jgi:hypothetical protein
MTDELTALHARIETLETQVAQLEAQVAHDNETRSQLLAACEGLVPGMERFQAGWNRQLSAGVAALQHLPEVEARQANGVLPTMARVLTEQRAIKEELTEQRGIVVDLHSRIGEVLELLLKRPS